jgi:two-component system, NtrC family, C4-dicarboxylate transport sensor histidine kinase DctB
MSVRKYPKIITLIGILLMLSVASWVSYVLSWRSGIDQLTAQNQQQLEQFVGHLESQLARFQFIPELIAKNQLLIEALNEPENSARMNLVNHFLEEVNTITGASDTYLMDDRGMTLAASNWQEKPTFVGRNFSFRPYFIEAMQGKQGHYFALGTTSGKRGYYFAYPLIYAAEVIGVIVLKMDLTHIEQRWSKRETQFMVVDDDGIIFITTQPDWLYHSIHPLSQQKVVKILSSQRYGDIRIKPMNYQISPLSFEQNIITQIVSPVTGKTQQYLTHSYAMPKAGWTAYILAPLDETDQASVVAMIIILLIGILMILTAALTWQRRRRRQERDRFQLESQKKLEQEVSIRTADLVNEIEEHKHTEQILRDTQHELIQTAKLAVLGQMSASISHELNNPLAAIRSYADNARQFLNLNKITQADENLSRIADLTERMGKISSQLKFFARKSSGNLETVVIEYVIQSSIDITSPQRKNSNVKIFTNNIQAGLSVRADHIQLEQVLVNLINNAVNALSNQQQGEVHISSEKMNTQVMIHVADNGPGIDEDNLERIFDPFFTTRKSGLGLGLSISSRIIDSMNGKLSAVNQKQGGACFSIALPSVE